MQFYIDKIFDTFILAGEENEVKELESGLVRRTLLYVNYHQVRTLTSLFPLL
jgi:hypothetical protein